MLHIHIHIFIHISFHMQEFMCVLHGFMYFLAIPSMSMLLMIYSLGNLHVTSWGTRESIEDTGTIHACTLVCMYLVDEAINILVQAVITMCAK